MKLRIAALLFAVALAGCGDDDEMCPADAQQPCCPNSANRDPNGDACSDNGASCYPVGITDYICVCTNAKWACRDPRPMPRDLAVPLDLRTSPTD